MRRLIIGMSGATGAIYLVRLLQILSSKSDIEVHLIVSPAAKETLRLETSYSIHDLKQLANVYYDYRDIGAAIASGSYITEGMIILPCSIKTLSGVANSYSDNLLVRAADVCLKERRPLVLAVRETPLHLGHLRLMAQVTEIGGVIMPLMPAFYNKPETIEQLVDHSIYRILDQLGIILPEASISRWH